MSIAPASVASGVSGAVGSGRIAPREPGGTTKSTAFCPGIEAAAAVTMTKVNHEEDLRMRIGGGRGGQGVSGHSHKSVLPCWAPQEGLEMTCKAPKRLLSRLVVFASSATIEADGDPPRRETAHLGLVHDAAMQRPCPGQRQRQLHGRSLLPSRCCTRPTRFWRHNLGQSRPRPRSRAQSSLPKRKRDRK